MVSLTQIISLITIICVLQCTGNPTGDKEENAVVTKLYTAEELKRARAVGIPDDFLIGWKKQDVTFDELIQLYVLAETYQPEVDVDVTSPNCTKPPLTFDAMAKVCKIVIPQQKTVASHTQEQHISMNELMKQVRDFPLDTQFSYIRTSVCAYISDPVLHEANANSFGLRLVPYMKFRFWNLRNEKSTGVERAYVAKELCCIYKGRENLNELKVRSVAFSMSDEQMTNIAEYWNEFSTANTSRSFIQVCEFLRTTNPSEEC